MNLIDQLKQISHTKDRLWNSNISYEGVKAPNFHSYGGSYLRDIQHTGARYNYELQVKWAFFYRNACTLLQALDGLDRRQFAYIVNVENSSWNRTFNERSIINATVVQSIAEVDGLKQAMLEDGYTMVHEESNWFMVEDTNTGRWKARLLVMHRNVDRNQLIDDALTYVSGKVIEHLNALFANLGSSETFSVEKLGVDEPEITTITEWLTELQKIEADELALREERKAKAAEIAEGITEKFINKLIERSKPTVKGKQLPLRGANKKEDLENQIANLRASIKDYTKEITRIYLDIENKEREYMSILCGTNDDFANLVAVLDKMLANGSPLKYYNLINGKLEMFFINPITYWEDDEIDQWHNTEQGKKWIDLITSKRFQVMTGCKVVISNSVSGTSVSIDGNDMHNTISDFVQNRIIAGGSEADEDNMWSRIDDYFSSKTVMLSLYKDHYVKQPHIARFSCFGNNERSIIDAFQNYNYDLGMSIVVHCVTQLNLTDGTVVRTLFDLLEEANYEGRACIWDTETQQYLIPSEALAMFNKSKEAEANETN